MKKKMSLRKKIFLSSMSLVTIIGVVLTLIFVFSADVKAIDFKSNLGRYDSKQNISWISQNNIYIW
mgnify:CR=1 FL=1